MALSPSLVWEVRSTGNSGNGGAFRAGAVGTDYSQQDTAQVVYNDLTVDSTTNTKISSPLNPFQPVHVGNTINISSATGGWTAGFYEVLSVSGGVATLDRSPAPVSTTGGIGKLGGAIAHPVTIQNVIVASNVIWIKQGSYSTQTLNFSATVSPTTTAPQTRLRGYGTTRGDNQRVSLTVTGSTSFQMSNGWDVANLDIAVSGSSTSIAVQLGTNCRISNCKVSGPYTISGIIINVASVAYGCEVTGGTSTSRGIEPNNTGSAVIGNYVHDCGGTGIRVSGALSVVLNNLVVNNGKEGVAVYSYGVTLMGNTIHNNGLSGIVNYTTNAQFLPILNNILSENVGYGITFAASAGDRANLMTDGNAYYANTSGARSNGDDTTVNPQNGIVPHINTRDVFLTGSPFVNTAGGDFRLNSTAGAGVACRGSGIPSSWPGSTVVGYPDMGVAQHQETPFTGGGGRIIGSGVVLPARKMA